MPLTDSDCKLLTAEIAHIKTAVDEIKIKLDANYVTKAEFWPVRTVVYSAVGAVGLSILAYWLKHLMGISK